MVLERLRDRTKNPENKAKYEEELWIPEFPESLRYIWNIFQRLSARRPVGFAASAIPYSEIMAYCQLQGRRLARWEISLIEELDMTYLSERRPVRDKPIQAQPDEDASKRPFRRQQRLPHMEKDG